MKKQDPTPENILEQMSMQLSDRFVEIQEIESDLSAIISRNSIVDIAAKVEVYQLMLDGSFQGYKNLQDQIDLLGKSLKIMSDSGEHNKLNSSFKKNLKSLPVELSYLNKRFDDVKKLCARFIADIYKH